MTDVRHMGAIPAEVQTWLVGEFNPRAVAAGLREVSVVPADNVLGQMATQRYQRDSTTTGAAAALPTVFYPTLAAAQGARQALAGR